MLQAMKVTTGMGSTSRMHEAEPARSGFARSESSVAQLMSQHLDLARPATDAEALRLLRQAFPGSPLTARVEALARRARI